MFAEGKKELAPKGRLAEDKGSLWAPKLSTWIKSGVEMGEMDKRRIELMSEEMRDERFHSKMERLHSWTFVGTLGMKKPFSTGIASYKEDADSELRQACTWGDTA